jgi:hypothetical protein
MSKSAEEQIARVIKEKVHPITKLVAGRELHLIAGERDAASAILALIPALSVREWMPIETIPDDYKDGRSLLGFDRDDAETVAEILWSLEGDKEGNYAPCWVTRSRYWFDPTHWMPLPAAPGAAPLPDVKGGEKKSIAPDPITGQAGVREEHIPQFGFVTPSKSEREAALEEAAKVIQQAADKEWEEVRKHSNAGRHSNATRSELNAAGLEILVARIRALASVPPKPAVSNVEMLSQEDIDILGDQRVGVHADAGGVRLTKPAVAEDVVARAKRVADELPMHEGRYALIDALASASLLRTEQSPSYEELRQAISYEVPFIKR